MLWDESNSLIVAQSEYFDFKHDNESLNSIQKRNILIIYATISCPKSFSLSSYLVAYLVTGNIILLSETESIYFAFIEINALTF
jgi:hypothetical protein